MVYAVVYDDLQTPSAAPTAPARFPGAYHIAPCRYPTRSLQPPLSNAKTQGGRSKVAV